MAEGTPTQELFAGLTELTSSDKTMTSDELHEDHQEQGTMDVGDDDYKLDDKHWKSYLNGMFNHIDITRSS